MRFPRRWRWRRREIPAPLRAELDAIYQRLLSDPSDRALNRRMIEIALQLEDYDAAIGAVERLIFYDPDNAELQLEAARLYLQIKSYAAAAGYLKDAVALPGLTDAQRDEVATLITAGRSRRAGIAVERIRPGRGALPDQRQYRLRRTRAERAVSLREAAARLERLRPRDARPRRAGQQERVDRGIAVGLLRGPAHSRSPRPRIRRDPASGPRFSTDDGALSAEALRPGAWHPARRRPLRGGLRRAARCSAGFSPTAGRWSHSSNSRIAPTTTRSTTPTRPDQTGDIYTYAVTSGASSRSDVSLDSPASASTTTHAAKAYQSYDQYFANVALQIAFDAFGKEDWSFSPFATISYTNFEGIAPPEEFAGFKTMQRGDLSGVSAPTSRCRSARASRSALPIEYNQNISNVDRDDYDNFEVRHWPAGQILEVVDEDAPFAWVGMHRSRSDAPPRRRDGARADTVGTAAAVRPDLDRDAPGRQRADARDRHRHRLERADSDERRRVAPGHVQRQVDADRRSEQQSRHRRVRLQPERRRRSLCGKPDQGALRFVGGQISHTAGATINTPVASLGIRGGAAFVTHDSVCAQQEDGQQRAKAAPRSCAPAGSATSNRASTPRTVQLQGQPGGRSRLARRGSVQRHLRDPERRRPRAGVAPSSSARIAGKAARFSAQSTVDQTILEQTPEPPPPAPP